MFKTNLIALKWKHQIQIDSIESDLLAEVT